MLTNNIGKIFINLNKTIEEENLSNSTTINIEYRFKSCITSFFVSVIFAVPVAGKGHDKVNASPLWRQAGLMGFLA